MSATTAFMNLFNDVDPPSDVSDEDVEDSKVHEGEEDILPSSQVTTISNDKMRITFGLQTPNPVEVTLKIDSGQCGGTTWPAGRVSETTKRSKPGMIDRSEGFNRVLGFTRVWEYRGQTAFGAWKWDWIGRHRRCKVRRGGSIHH